MNVKLRKQLIRGSAALALACLLGAPAFAATGGAVPDFKAHTGTIQNIDYLHHAITVNGHTYAVTSDARFSGIAGFSVLHIGMPIRFVLSQPRSILAPPQSTAAAPDDTPAVITQITWLPGGA